MRYRAFYYSGGNTPKPGPINIIITGKGVKLTIGMKQFIDYKDIDSTSIEYKVIEKEFSAGKAVAGGILFGGIGALAGGAMGGEKAKSYLTIKYRMNGESKELLLTSPVTEKLKKLIDQHVEKAGRVQQTTQPVPPAAVLEALQQRKATPPDSGFMKYATGREYRGIKGFKRMVDEIKKPKP